jgi:hypothetical protein
MRSPHFRGAAGLLSAFTLLALPLTGCSPRLIPGTEIPDTPTDRNLLTLMHHFRDSFQSKDTDALVAMASPRYLDARDSISYDTLKTQLKSYFDKVKELHLDVTVRRITVEGAHARIDYVFAINYLLDTVDPKWRSQTDDRRMTLVREDNTWKITSGY